MTKITKNLISELKEHDEDFEWYPTTKEMVEPIFRKLPSQVGSVLDIGAGTCTFKKYFNEYSDEYIKQKTEEENKKHEMAQSKGESYYKRIPDKPRINEYYAIEKSKILINGFDKDTIVLGTDFHESLLIDKNVDYIFCNPPYSEYETWTKRIILEGNCYKSYLIIPQR